MEKREESDAADFDPTCQAKPRDLPLPRPTRLQDVPSGAVARLLRGRSRARGLGKGEAENQSESGDQKEERSRETRKSGHRLLSLALSSSLAGREVARPGSPAIDRRPFLFLSPAETSEIEDLARRVEDARYGRSTKF